MLKYEWWGPAKIHLPGATKEDMNLIIILQKNNTKYNVQKKTYAMPKFHVANASTFLQRMTPMISWPA